jgi:spermidine synthase
VAIAAGPGSIPAESELERSAPEEPESETPGSARADLGAQPFAFGVLLATAFAGAAHETLLVQPAAYLAAGAEPTRQLVGLTGLGAAAFGVLSARHRWPDAFSALPWMLGLASVAVGSSSAAIHAVFASGGAVEATAFGSALAVGATSGASITLALRALGRTLMQLEVPWRLANPFRLLAVAVLSGTAAGVASVLGPLRSSFALAMLLAALAAWTPTLRWFLERRARPGAMAARVAGFVGVLLFLGSFGAAERLVPLSELGAYPNPVVFHRVTDLGRYTVTSGQDALELWVDGRLKASTLDERRYFEALVHPAMTVAPRRTRVLVLGGGAGFAEREILRHPDVDSVTLVLVDRALVEVGRTQRWLRRRTNDALSSQKLHVIEREPIVWLAEGGERFDVAILDLPDPDTHVEGKNFTRYFFTRLRERLAPGGVCVVQGTSPFVGPTTFDSVVATLRAAGLHPRPYRAAVPSLGDWGFVLGFVDRPASVSFEAAAPFLSGASPAELAHLPRDMAPPTPGRPATLDDQTVVDDLHREVPR